MLKNITNLGDAALYCDFGDKVNIETNSVVIKYFNQIRSLRIDGILNLTPSYNKLIISFDLNLTSSEKLIKIIKNVNTNEKLNIDKKIIEIPICLKDEFSLDLDRLVANLKLNKSAIFKTFLSKNYFCYMTGFIAGMPFLGDISNDLRFRRLDTPRVKVPKGSVGVTEQFCNIYSFESPGGWNIIGRTPFKIFDRDNESKPSLINPGDYVKFYEIDSNEYSKLND
tara:strand:- start:334 stop:1008 length:675 start_codon:yes stop_codon:yes gene_type:complete